MKTTFTIFKLSLRTILRERVAVSMLGLLVLILVLLPSGLQGDGTVQGAIQMQVRYSLGFSFALLAGMTLWVSCASVSGDLTSKRLQMVLTKPVSRMSVWFGKWLSVVTVVSLLGLLCGGVTLFRIHQIISAAEMESAERSLLQTQVLTARKPLDVPPMDLSEEAKQLFIKQQAAGALPPQANMEDLLPKIERYLQVERFAVDKESASSWTLPLPTPPQPGEEFQLFYHYDGLTMGSTQVNGEWVISDPDGESFFRFPVQQSPQGGHALPFTVPKEMAGATSLELTFRNLAPEGSKIFFQTDQGIRLFHQGGSFSLNLFRSVFLFCGLLSILAAIGVSAGSMFSLPVACYSTMVVLVLQAFSGIVSEVVEQGFPARPEEVSSVVHLFTQARFILFQGILILIQPMQMESPLGRVAEGVLIPSSEVFAVLSLRFLPIIGVAALIGIFFFSKREVGDAS